MTPQQQRLEKQRQDIQAAQILQAEKVKRFREAFVVEADANRKAQLEQQLQAELAILARLESDLRALETTIAIHQQTPHNLTQAGAIAFVGRESALENLQTLLQESNTVSIYAVQGMGGIGKTELALQFAYGCLDRQSYPGGICWLNARTDMQLSLLLFARSHLDLQPPTDLEAEAQLRWCWAHWRSGKALLVLDDVQDYAAVEALEIPGRSQFQVLLTSRSRLISDPQTLALPELTEEAALELLRSWVKDGRVDRDLEMAKSVAQWLGYLPLGLELVGRYLARKPDVAIATLYQRLQDKRLEAKALKDRSPGMTATVGVAAAFELSWQDLSIEVQQLAALLSLFAAAEMPWQLVQDCLPESDGEEIEDWRDGGLVDRSLLKRVDTGNYRLHQLLREFFAVKRREMAAEEEMARSYCRVMVAVAKQIPQTITLSQITQFEPAIPHLKEAATTLHPTLPDEDLITPATRIAWFYQGQANYKEAEGWKKHCLAIVLDRLGQDHPATAASLNNLAELYRSQGRYSEAEPLYVRSLHITETQLGQDHPDTAASLNNLAELYRSQGRYSEAEPLYVRSLHITETQLGQDHPATATSLNNLALLYESQGRYSEAEPLYVRSLHIRETQLGQDHPHTATGLNNLAELYRSQGRYSEAEPLYVRSLYIYETQLGQDHPHTATGLNNLAGLYRSQGRYSEAEPLCVRSLHITETQLGQDHPDTASSLNNLAALYKSQGRYSEAEPLLVRSCIILLQKLGQDHPNTQTILNNFVTCLQSAIESGQGDRLSDHPLTQHILQQLLDRGE